MRRYRLVGCLSVFHLLHTELALGCGPTPTLVSLLLPEADAPEVGTNAALIGSNNYGPLTFTLRRVPSPTDDDAGVADDLVSVALETTCYPAFEGNLCIASPRSPLRPNANYEWSVSSTPVEPARSEQWRLFTTGNGEYDDTPAAVTAVVLDHVAFDTPDPCGNTNRVSLEVEGSDLTAPLVVNVKGFTPSYVIEPIVLSPQVAEQPWTLHSAPECFTLELFTASGTRRELEPTCLTLDLPDDTNSSNVTSTTPSEGTSTNPVEVAPANPSEKPAPPPGEPDPSATTAGRVSSASTPSNTTVTDEPDEPPKGDAQEHADAKTRSVSSNQDHGCDMVPSAQGPARVTLLSLATLLLVCCRRRRQ